MSQQQVINVGTAPNDGLGDPIRTAFIKTNENFSTLFATAGITGIANGTSNISIPVANGSILFAVGNTSNIVVFQANGAAVTGNLSSTLNMSTGNLFTSGLIVANGTIQSLGAVTAVTVTASGNLVGGNLNITNQLRATNLSLTGNVIGAQLNVTGNIAAANIAGTGDLSLGGSNLQMTGFGIDAGNISATGSNLSIAGFSVVGGNVTTTGNIVGSGTLLEITGFSANSGVVTVAANTTISGNVAAPYFIGNGSQLFGITAAPANIFNTIDINNGTSVIVADSPNDTLRMLAGNNIQITGNAVTDTITYAVTNNPVFDGTVTAKDFLGDLKGTVVADDSSIMVDAVDNKLFAMEITSSGNISATGDVVAVGNVSGAYILGNGALLTGVITTVDEVVNGGSNIVIPAANSNIYIAVNNTANVAEFDANGLRVAANVQADVLVGNTVNVTGNVNCGNLNVTGNIANISVVDLVVDDPLILLAANNVADTDDIGIVGIYDDGSVQHTGLARDHTDGVWKFFTDLAATPTTVVDWANVVYANVQTGNIQNIGEISSTGNVTAPYFLGNVIGNISGNLTVAGSNTQVIFNDDGVANATSGFTFNKTTNAISAGGAVSAVGNITGGNIITAGVLTAGGNVTGGNILTAGILDATGNVTGANINTGGLITATGNITATANLAGGNISTAGIITATGNLAAGNISTAGIITVNSGDAATAIVNGGSNAVGNIGSESNYFNRVFATSTSALYADLAEYFLADADYAAGTVMILGGAQEVTTSTGEQDPRVIGVVSAQPSYLMNTGLQGEFPTAIALTGRVPCQVIGPVRPGDLLMTSPRPGTACAIPPDMARPGHVFAKAIGQHLSSEPGIIEVVVGLR